MKKTRMAAIALLLTILLNACNLPIPTQTITNEMQTLAAQTVQAVLTPLSSPTALATTSVPIATQTSGPILTVPDNTNCRSGPGTNYGIVTVLAAGSSVRIVAQYSGGTYWIVDPPSESQTCWVAAEFGTVTGEINVLAEVTPVVDSNSGAPARPGSLFYNYSCSGSEVTTTLTWADAADNENGYRVYRFGTAIADLPANSGQYVDIVTITPGTQLQFAVEAYNDTGASPQRTASFSC